MKRYLEIEDQLKEKGIVYRPELPKVFSVKGYYNGSGTQPISKAELASALRDIFKIGTVVNNTVWLAFSSICNHEAISYKDADTATLLVVDKIMEKE